MLPQLITLSPTADGNRMLAEKVFWGKQVASELDCYGNNNGCQMKEFKSSFFCIGECIEGNGNPRAFNFQFYNQKTSVVALREASFLRATRSTLLKIRLKIQSGVLRNKMNSDLLSFLCKSLGNDWQ